MFPGDKQNFAKKKEDSNKLIKDKLKDFQLKQQELYNKTLLKAKPQIFINANDEKDQDDCDAVIID